MHKNHQIGPGNGYPVGCDALIPPTLGDGEQSNQIDDQCGNDEQQVDAITGAELTILATNNGKYGNAPDHQQNAIHQDQKIPVGIGVCTLG